MQATQDELRRRMHGMWAAVAPAWDEHADYVDARGAEVAERMLELAALRPGDRVLELACGPGGLGLAAAGRVGPAARSCSPTWPPEMTAIAAARARAAGLANVSARVLDLEDVDEPDGEYDAVLCREGLMFAVDPARAAREIGACCGPAGGSRSPSGARASATRGSASSSTRCRPSSGGPCRRPACPGRSRSGTPGGWSRCCADAGLEEVAAGEHDVPLRAASFDEWWTRTSALAGPLAAILASLPEPAVRGLRERLEEATAPYRTPAGLELPGLSLVAAGVRR